MEIIKKYFPDLSHNKAEKYRALYKIYKFWNSRINLISRNDIENLYERHILYSLLIAKITKFNSTHKILDVGTGGGFPGIPLAILFPETNFHLIDSKKKKITVVKEIVKELNLENVTVEHINVEDVKSKYDFIVSRAVTNFPRFVSMSKNKVSNNNRGNGIFYLKGGDFNNEIMQYKKSVEIYNANNWFEEEYFVTKKLIFLSI